MIAKGFSLRSPGKEFVLGSVWLILYQREGFQILAMFILTCLTFASGHR